jgi:hypothetical protein
MRMVSLDINCCFRPCRPRPACASPHRTTGHRWPPAARWPRIAPVSDSSGWRKPSRLGQSQVIHTDNVGRYNGLSLPPGIPAPGPRVPPAPSPSAEPLSPGRRLSPRFIPPPSSGASKTSSRDRGVSARDVNLAALRRGTSRGTGRRLSPRPPRREGPRNILTEIGECRGGAVASLRALANAGPWSRNKPAAC